MFTLRLADGSIYGCEAKLIADNRARYYAEREAEREGADYHRVYAEEMAYALGDDVVLTDWAQDNMDADDIAFTEWVQLKPAPTPGLKALITSAWRGGNEGDARPRVEELES
jgi:hypothetical protein